MKGKEKCRILKEIRQKIADENDIPYVTSECKHQGDCRGTCPKCERELQYLENELARRRALGKSIAVAGLVATFTLSSTGCLSPMQEEILSGDMDIEQVETETETETEKENAVTGDMVEDDFVDHPTTGAPLPDGYDFYIQNGTIYFNYGIMIPTLETLSARIGEFSPLEAWQCFIGIDAEYLRIGYAEYLYKDEEQKLYFSHPDLPITVYDEYGTVIEVYENTAS